jgi:hypothetical protein
MLGSKTWLYFERAPHLFARTAEELIEGEGTAWYSVFLALLVQMYLLY